MYKATREFIKMRQEHAKKPLNPVKVKQVGGKSEGDCFNNAYGETQDNKGAVGIISGWLVGKYDEDNKSTAVIQHFWNYDLGKDEHYDITLYNETHWEYVIDRDILDYGQENFNDLQNLVATSVCYMGNGEIYAVKDLENFALLELNDLSNEQLFRYNWKK